MYLPGYLSQSSHALSLKTSIIEAKANFSLVFDYEIVVTEHCKDDSWESFNRKKLYLSLYYLITVE